MEQPTAGVTADVSSLHCMPGVLADILKACLAGASAQKLSDIVLQDAPFAAKLIDMAIKLGFAELDSREPVLAAIQHLGSQTVTGLALCSARQILHHQLAAAELDFLLNLWRTSRFAGQAARCIAPSVNYSGIEEAQLGGLLQNLGIYLLLHKHRTAYLAISPTPWCRTEQLADEQRKFKADHLQIAADLVERWGLDSFLGDALRFLLADSRQLEATDPLLRIVRLAQSFTSCGSEPTVDVIRLAERFFSLRQSETDYLFGWVKSLTAGIDHYVEELRRTFTRDCQALTDQVMLVAGQETARARLVRAESPADLARIATGLYLETDLTTGALLLLYDQRSQQLVGFAAPGRSGLSREIRVPMLAEASLATRALEQNLVLHSRVATRPLSVTDRLLIRLCGSTEILCQPLQVDGQGLAVVVFGMATGQDPAAFQSAEMVILHPVVSAALLTLLRSELSDSGDVAAVLRRMQHEMGNSLTIIGNYAEVLKRQLADGSGREQVDAIKHEVHRIDEMLNYHLQQQDMPGFPGQEVDLNQMLVETVEALDAVDLAPRGVTVHYRLQQHLPRVTVLPVLVRQILANLLKNAAEAMPRGGEITLVTRDGYCAQGQRFVEISVADNGPGLPEAVLDRLFQPVVSSKGGGHSGIGLSIVKSMIEDLKGHIRCHSVPDQGTTFDLQIPVKSTACGFFGKTSIFAKEKVR